MDFFTLNFGQFLHLLDNELKNIIRNFEKQKKKKLNEGLVPLNMAYFLTKHV